MPHGSSSPIRIAVTASLAVAGLLVVLWQVGSGGATSQAVSAVPPGGLQSSAVGYRAGNGVGVSSVGTTPVKVVAAIGTPTSQAARTVQSVPVSNGGRSLLAPRVRGAGTGAGAGEGIVRVTRDLAIRRAPGSGNVIGTLPRTSPYLNMPVDAWIRTRSSDGRWGLVTVPWTLHSRSGWIRLDGLQIDPVNVHIDADLSARTITVVRAGHVIFSAPTAIGAAGSPSPVGDFWINDPVAVGPDQPQFGSYAFGLSALQPHTPRGWTGGNQMAIHGTDNPGSIGTAASAGCLRVSDRTISRLRTLVAPGTPVTIHA